MSTTPSTVTPGTGAATPSANDAVANPVAKTTVESKAPAPATAATRALPPAGAKPARPPATKPVAAAPKVGVAVPEVVDTRTPAQIEADIVATQVRLAHNIAGLKAHAQPKAIAGRQVERARAFYVDEFGGIRVDRAAATGAVFVGVLLLSRLLRRHR